MCGGEYAPYHKRQRFCSETCQRAWWKQNRKKAGKKHTFVCQQCGKTYRTTHADRNTCCSRECGLAYSAQQALETRFESEAIDKVCLSCGQRFRDWPCKPDYCSEECRERGAKLVCDVCGEAFYGHPNVKYCSDGCRRKVKRHRHRVMKQRLGRTGGRLKVFVCKQCGMQFTQRVWNNEPLFCSKDCARKHWRDSHPVKGKHMQSRANSMRRARKHGNGRVESIDHQAVFQRDGWVCGICGKRCEQSLRFPHPLSATLDHIVPLARGGTHTWANVQCAHFACNSRKQDAGIGQLRLGTEPIDITGGPEIAGAKRPLGPDGGLA